MTFWFSFHWPRFLRSSTRSKRFSTLRLAAMVLAPFKLRCCDMVYVKRVKMLQGGKMSGKIKLLRTFFKWITSGPLPTMYLVLYSWLLSTTYVPDAAI